MAGESKHRSDEWHNALDLLQRILEAHDLEVRRGTGRHTNGALGPATHRVFRILATEPGAFTRPVPFDREEVAIYSECTEPAVSKALTRLADKGMATVSGERGAWLVQLHLPPPIFAAYETYERRFAEDFEKGSLGPVSRQELDRVLALLDPKEADPPVACGRLTRH
jgi:hypothetical protein